MIPSLNNYFKNVEELLKQAKDGEPWAIRELLTRCLGRPSQALSIEGDGLTLGQIIKVLRANHNK